jgi:hypothetical protein
MELKALYIALSTAIFAFSICFLRCSNKPSTYSDEAKKLLEPEKEAIQREFNNDTAFSIVNNGFYFHRAIREKNKE